MHILNYLSRFFKREEGQTLTEYGILVLLILLVVILVLSLLGNTLSALYNNFITTAFGG